MSMMSDKGTRIPAFHVGDRLQKARTTAGLSQGEMADELGVDRRTLSRWENGAGVKRATVLLYAMRTGVDAGWIETGHAPADIGPDPSGGHLESAKKITERSLAKVTPLRAPGAVAA